MEEKNNKYLKMLHPEYDTLTQEKQEDFQEEKKFIDEHLEEIEKCYKEKKAYEVEEDSEIIEEVIRIVKSRIYKNMLYPDNSKLDSTDRDTIGKNKIFINKHVEEIESEYKEAIRHGAKEGDSKIIEEAIRTVKSRIYKNMLYPNDSEINLADKQTVEKNKLFIDEHVEEIEKWYEEAISHGNKEEDSKIIEEAIRMVKSRKYKNMLYPDYNKLDPTVVEAVAENSLFIKEHVDEIESEYERIKKENERQDISNQEIMENIIESMQNEHITTQQIGKRTKNASIEIKRKANEVEEKENNIVSKEGEKSSDS